MMCRRRHHYLPAPQRHPIEDYRRRAAVARGNAARAKAKAARYHRRLAALRVALRRLAALPGGEAAEVALHRDDAAVRRVRLRALRRKR